MEIIKINFLGGCILLEKMIQNKRRNLKYIFEIPERLKRKEKKVKSHEKLFGMTRRLILCLFVAGVLVAIIGHSIKIPTSYLNVAAIATFLTSMWLIALGISFRINNRKVTRKQLRDALSPLPLGVLITVVFLNRSSLNSVFYTIFALSFIAGLVIIVTIELALENRAKSNRVHAQ